MRTGLIAKKLGMTRVFRDDGSHVPVTLLSIEKNYVTGVKNNDLNDYKQIQIATGNIKIKKVSKPIKSFFSKIKIEPRKKISEFKISKDTTHNIGDILEASFFKVGQYVDLIGRSIGKGFAGAIKRHNFSGLKASHGVSVSHRSLGSTGQCQDPGRTFKGKKMAGHMGFRKVTIHNLEVVEVNNEDGILCIKGAVPGSKGSFVVIRDAIKSKSLTVKIKKVVEEVEESSKEKKASDTKKEDKKEGTVVKNDNKGEKK